MAGKCKLDRPDSLDVANKVLVPDSRAEVQQTTVYTDSHRTMNGYVVACRRDVVFMLLLEACVVG